MSRINIQNAHLPVFDYRLIRRMRREAGLTQAALAKVVGISRETLVAIENSHRAENMSAIRALTLEICKNIHNALKDLVAESTTLEFRAAVLKYFGF